MIQMINKLKKNQKGFTLVELIVVLVILAILAAFTIPAMLGFVNDAKDKAEISKARELYVAAQAVATEFSAKGVSNSDIITGIQGFGATSAPTAGDSEKVYESLIAKIGGDVTGTITGVTMDGAKVTKLIYTPSGTNAKAITVTQNASGGSIDIA